jgi:hypothetical protein
MKYITIIALLLSSCVKEGFTLEECAFVSFSSVTCEQTPDGKPIHNIITIHKAEHLLPKGECEEMAKRQREQANGVYYVGGVITDIDNLIYCDCK